MIKILFVCHGNICRSTLSESVFTHKVNTIGLENMFVIDSAATSREEIGNPPHRGTVNKLRELGAIASAFCSYCSLTLMLSPPSTRTAPLSTAVKTDLLYQF